MLCDFLKVAPESRGAGIEGQGTLPVPDPLQGRLVGASCQTHKEIFSFNNV